MACGGPEVPRAVGWNVPADFGCRIVEFARYLDVDATYDRRERTGRMYRAWYRGRIAGCMMLAAGRAGREGQADLGIDTYGMLPALVIARLATDERHEGNGVGRSMIRHALDIADRLATDVGCRVVFANSEPDAVGFYEKMGFVKFAAMRHLPSGSLPLDPRACCDAEAWDGSLVPMYVDLGTDALSAGPGNGACRQ